MVFYKGAVVVYGDFVPRLFSLVQPGTAGVTLWPFVFLKKGSRVEVLFHELVHIRQQREMLVVGFYAWYVVEWVMRMLWCGLSSREAYRAILFEREARGVRTVADLGARVAYGWLRGAS